MDHSFLIASMAECGVDGGHWSRNLIPTGTDLIGGNANPRGCSVKSAMSSSQPSPPSTPPSRPSSTRPFGSPLRPQSPTLPSGTTSLNPRTRVVSQQSTSPNRGDSVLRTPSSGSANASTASLPNPNQLDRTRSKARDLLRKHYGLGVGPPPPSGKPQDPMDLGESRDHTPTNVPYPTLIQTHLHSTPRLIMSS